VGEMADNDSSQPLPIASQPAQAYRVGGLDSVDACRLRLMALRVRIDTNWPKSGGILRRTARPDRNDPLGRLLAALPTPLPVRLPGVPEPLIRESDTDLRAVAGRAVDAAMLLLDCGSLEDTFPGEVTMLAGIGASGAAADLAPVSVSDPTIGLLVATMIGTLEAVSEYLTPSTGRRDVGR
jgi:hypothetical protein